MSLTAGKASKRRHGNFLLNSRSGEKLVPPPACCRRHLIPARTLLAASTLTLNGCARWPGNPGSTVAAVAAAIIVVAVVRAIFNK